MIWKLSIVKIVTVYCLLIYQKHFVSTNQDHTTRKNLPEETGFKNYSGSNFAENGTMDHELFTYTEGFISVRARREIDLKKLMLEYSAICPVIQKCGVDFDRKYLFEGYFYGIPGFEGCPECQCSRHCVEDENCCPGSYFGYVPHECTNVLQYSNEDREMTYYTVGTCLDEFKINETLVKYCESEVVPCTSIESGLVYRNQYCAKCNADSNCINWRLDVDCKWEGITNQEFYSYADIKAALDKFECEIEYKPTAFTDVGSIPCSIKEDEGKVQIDRCNVTGLWRQYNADIDWACNNFIVPYKLFKNVFCYICNPSHGNVRGEHSIENCFITENSTEFLINVSLACESFPVSDRLQPFKNIYCYVCTIGHDLLINSETEVLTLAKIAEMNDHSSLKTKIDISLIFPYDNNVYEVERFVHETLKTTFKHVGKNSKVEVKNRLDFTNIHNITSLYEVVCGNGLFCTNDRTGNESYYSNPVCGYCSCDLDCAEYETCCLDMTIIKQPYTCLNSNSFPILKKHDNPERNSFFEIEEDNNKYKVIDTCLNESHDLSGKCSLYGDTNDLLDDIPISTWGNIAYRNIYCYKCNNQRIKNIILDFQAYCSTFIEIYLFTDLTQFLNTLMTQCHTISFVPLMTETCIPKYDALSAGYIGGDHFQRVKEHPSRMNQVVFQTERVKFSERNETLNDVFSYCNITGYQKEENHIVENICESYSPTVASLPEYRVDNKVYKNFACFLCNPEYNVLNISAENFISDCKLNNSVEWYEENTILNELCDSMPRQERWFPFKNMYCAECNLPPWQQVNVEVAYYDVLSPANYKYIFSLSPEDFNKMEQASSDKDAAECLNGTYDYNLKQCRSLYCIDGSQLYKTSCKPLFETAYNHLYTMQLYLHIKELDGSSIDERRNVTYIELEKLCLNISQIITDKFDDTTEFYIQEMACKASTPCLTPTITVELKYVGITTTNLISLYFTIHIEHTESVSYIRTVLVNALSRKYDVHDLFDNEANIHSVLLEPVRDIDPIDPGSVCNFQYLVFKEYEEIVYLKRYKVDKFLQCAYVKINQNETIISNDTLIISTQDKNVSFSKDEYGFENDNVIICIDDFNAKTNNIYDENRIDSDDVLINALNVFTLVCTIISLLSLFLTFITYCLFLSLQTIPGKGVMLVCFSLFFAQASLQFGLNGTSKSLTCVITGIAIHYCWLALFCAMNICSFHMFRVFYFSELSNQVPHNKKMLFMKYLLYFLLWPLVFVVIAVSINLFHSDAMTVGYGVNYCFISDFYIFVGTFLTPACLICLNNFIFFSLAFHKIRSTPDVQSNQNKNYFNIFIKLSILVGITWPLLIVDNIVGVSWFSFVASGINSLQGTFVFISFILNKRVLYLYKSKFIKTADKQVSRSDSNTTYSIINKTRN